MSNLTLYIPHSLHQQFPSQFNNSISCGEVYSLELTPHPAKSLTSNTLIPELTQNSVFQHSWFLQVSLIYTRFFISFISFITPRQFNNVSKVHKESWVACRHWKLGEWLGKTTYFNMLTWMKQDNSQQNQDHGWISLPESFHRTSYFLVLWMPHPEIQAKTAICLGGTWIVIQWQAFKSFPPTHKVTEAKLRKKQSM